MGNSVRFRTGDKIVPKHEITSPLEEGLSSLKEKKTYVIRTVTSTAQKQTVHLVGVKGEFYAADFEKYRQKATGKKQRLKKPPQALVFDGLSRDA